MACRLLHHGPVMMMLCPSCPTGVQARADAWNVDFGSNLFVAVLPLLVIGLICMRIERS